MEEKWPRHKADCLPPSNAEVNNEWGYTAIHPYALMACIRQPCLPTPCSRVLLEKLIGSQLVKNLSALYGTPNSLPHSQVLIGAILLCCIMIK